MKKKGFVSSVAKEKLSRVDSDSLFALSDINKNDRMKNAVVKVVRQMIDEEKDYILSLNSGDDKLSIKHSDSKGRIAGLTLFIHMIEGTGLEIEKREEAK